MKCCIKMFPMTQKFVILLSNNWCYTNRLLRIKFWLDSVKTATKHEVTMQYYSKWAMNQFLMWQLDWFSFVTYIIHRLFESTTLWERYNIQKRVGRICIKQTNIHANTREKQDRSQDKDKTVTDMCPHHTSQSTSEESQNLWWQWSGARQDHAYSPAKFFLNLVKNQLVPNAVLAVNKPGVSKPYKTAKVILII